MSQQSHRSDPRILNRRTLQRDHPYLARVLRTGMEILDVGCGTGAITADIAKAVGPDGMALGIDRDDASLVVAVQQYGGMGNLRFEGASAQMRAILAGLDRVLRQHAKIFPDAITVRFKELAASSLNIE